MRTIYDVISEKDEGDDFSFTEKLEATYYVDAEGKQLSFGYDRHAGRYNDHRIIFGLVEGVEDSDYRTLITKYNLLMVMPEVKECLWIKDIEMSEKQKEFIQKYDLNLFLE